MKIGDFVDHFEKINYTRKYGNIVNHD